MLSAAGSLWCCRQHSAAQHSTAPSAALSTLLLWVQVRAVLPRCQIQGPQSSTGKKEKDSPALCHALSQAASQGAPTHPRFRLFVEDIPSQKEFTSKIRRKKKQKLSILPIPVFLAEVGELFGRAGIYSANTCVSIFMTGGFLMPASSFKAMGAVMIPTELSLGAEQELDFLLLYVTLGRHTACLESLWSLPGFRPRALRSQSSG